MKNKLENIPRRGVDKKNESEITLKMELDFEKELMNILNGGELSF